MELVIFTNLTMVGAKTYNSTLLSKWWILDAQKSQIPQQLKGLNLAEKNLQVVYGSMDPPHGRSTKSLWCKVKFCKSFLKAWGFFEW